MREECTQFAEKLTGLFSDIVVKTMTVQLLRELDELEISLSQLQALTFIAEHGKCSVGAIAEGLGVTHPAAVKLVDKLARKALVTRGVAAADHRQSEIAVTEAGRLLVHRVRQERTQRLAAVLDRMEPEERQALISGLQAFVTAALRDEQALDALCRSCQMLLPTDCDEFRLISSSAAAAAAGSAAGHGSGARGGRSAPAGAARFEARVRTPAERAEPADAARRSGSQVPDRTGWRQNDPWQ